MIIRGFIYWDFLIGNLILLQIDLKNNEFYNIIFIMLKYHKISSQPCETKMQKIEHYLTLGSYQCEHKIDGIKSFSFVTMMPETRMTISNNLSESETNYLIPISNTVRVDETVISPNEIIKNPKHVQEI